MLLPWLSYILNPDAGIPAWGIYQKRLEGSQKEMRIMPQEQEVNHA
jgi:hypothetical protein